MIQHSSVRGGADIYTRNYGRPNHSGVRYNPPPGYDGNAFSDTTNVKMHEAEDDITMMPRRSRESYHTEKKAENHQAAEEIPGQFKESQLEPYEEPEENEVTPFEGRKDDTVSCTDDSTRGENGKSDVQQTGVMPFGNSIRALEALFKSLHGKFGREELIIVLVMLLIASEGTSIELLLLALVLIAG